MPKVTFIIRVVEVDFTSKAIDEALKPVASWVGWWDRCLRPVAAGRFSSEQTFAVLLDHLVGSHDD